jgi:hypothetical protein
MYPNVKLLRKFKNKMEEKRSYYRVELPETCVAFASDEGRTLFREALEDGTMENYCGVSLNVRRESNSF